MSSLYIPRSQGLRAEQTLSSNTFPLSTVYYCLLLLFPQRKHNVLTANFRII